MYTDDGSRRYRNVYENVVYIYCFGFSVKEKIFFYFSAILKLALINVWYSFNQCCIQWIELTIFHVYIDRQVLYRFLPL